MRLIDADRFEAFCTGIPKDVDADSFMRGIDEVIYEIDNAPTVDAVKVVRCCKCLYWKEYTVRQNSNDAGWWNEALCERHTIYGNEPHEAWTAADWYCADGERREDE